MLAKAVGARCGYVARVFPPRLARGPVQEAKREVALSAARCVGWTPAEAAAVAGQVALHPGDGGLGLATVHRSAPFLASWWDAQAVRQGLGVPLDPAEVIRAAGRDRSKALLAERDQLLAKLLQLQRSQAAEVSGLGCRR